MQNLFTPLKKKHERCLPARIWKNKKLVLKSALLSAITTLCFNVSHAQSNALHFDGSDDYVSVASPYYTFDKEITVEWWANISAAPVGSGIGQGVQGIDDMANNVWLMHSHGDGTIQFFVNDNGTYRSSGQIAYGSGWHHYVGVANTAGVFFYIDGNLVTSSSTGISSGIINVSSSVVHLGKDVRYATSRFLGGSIDEVRIWNRALCQTEIQVNRSCELSSMVGLVEYYKLNQGTAGGTNTGITSATDGSGNSRTGTLNNFALSGSTSNWITGNVSGNCSVYAPAISGVSPYLGNPTSAVTITGTKFNATAANNIVYFGATKATVSSGSATSLSVTVPTGAMHKSVTIGDAVCKLSAQSQYSFLPTYNNTGFIAGTVNLSPKVDFNSGDAAYAVATGDVDGDGKADVVYTDYNANTITVRRNISTSGSITSGSFTTGVSFATGSGPYYVVLADIDIDGKLDIVVANTSGGSISVLRNTATSGAITTASFAAKVDIATGSSVQALAVGDIDMDGRPDIAVAAGGSLRLHKNLTSGNVVAFNSGSSFSAGSAPRGVALSDIDGDGKQDVVVANAGSNSISVFRNISTAGTISSGSLASAINFATGSQPFNVATGDLDGDGKPDIAVTNVNDNTVSVFHNAASSGTITTTSLDAKQDFAVGASSYSVAIADMDGDGKADILASNSNTPSAHVVSVLRNTATSGSISGSSFAIKVDFTANGFNYGLSICDMDGDQKPDVIAGGSSGTGFAIFRNSPLTPITGATSVCVGSTTTLGESATGGSWVSASPSIASIGSANGVVSGLTTGSAVISYTAPGGTVTMTISVNPLPTVSAITGNTTLSTAITTQLSSTPTGGVWASSNATVDTVNSSTGIVSGLTAGTSRVSYTVTSLGCSTTVTTNVTVNTPLVGLSFDGTNDHIALPASLTSTCSNFTFETWMYVSSSSTWARIMDFGNNTNVYMFLTPFSNGGTPRFAITTSDNPGQQQLNAPSPVSLNTWTHIAVTIDGSANMGKMYINGALVATNSSMTLNPTLLGALANNWLGKSQYVGDPYLNGRLDEVRIWNTTRTASEIVDNMNCNVAQNANLLAYYRFENGVAGGTNTSLTTTPDYSGNSNCGTLNNFGLTGTTSNFVTGAVGSCNTITLSLPAITGTATVCPGAATTLSDATSGGTWSSSTPTVGTISAGGVVSALTAGTTTISYAVCGIVTTRIVTVNPLPTVSAITGNTTLSSAISTKLSDATTGGVWASGNTSAATVNSSTGLVAGVAAGTSTISYTITSLGCSTTVTTNVTVNTPGVGINFDGVNDRIDGTNNALPQGSAPRTIEAWVKTTTTSGSQVIFNWGTFSVNQRSGLLLSGNHLYFVGESNDFGASSAVVPTNVWTHVAVTLTGTAVQFFINGVLAQSGTISSTPATTGSSWSISNTNNYAPTREPFVGSIDEIRVWNTVRTQSEIAANMNCDVAQQTGLVAYYRFDNGVASGTNTSNNSAIDYSSNGACGALTNMSLAGTSSNYVTGAVGNCNSISPVSPGAFTGNAPVCVGSTMTLGNGVSGGTWSTASSNISVNASTGVVTGITAGIAFVSYTRNCISASVIVTVNALPVLDAGSNTAICYGASTARTVTGAATYAWSPATGLDATSGTNVTASPTVTTTYTITGTSSVGCVNTTTTTVSVNPLPAITGTSVVCQGGTVALSGSIPDGAWTSSAPSAASVDSTGVVTGTATGVATTTYTLPTGCYGTQVVNVNANPSTTIDITGSSVFCDGGSAILTPSITGSTAFMNAPAANGPTTVCDCPPGYVAVGLSGGAGTWMDRFTIHCRQLVGGTLTGGIVATASNGASGGGSFQGPYLFSGNKVMVGASAIASWANTFHGITGYGQEVSYIAAGGNNSASPTALTEIHGASGVSSLGSVFAPAGMVITGMYTYDNWFVTGVAFRYKPISSFATTSTAGSPYTWSTGDTSSTITVNTSGIYSVSYAAANGCSSTASTSITVNPLPADIAGVSEICVGATTTLSDSTAEGVWTSSNTTVATIDLTTGVVNALNAGTTTITYTLPTGCTKTMTFVVNPNPAITGAFTVCEASATALGATISGGTWASSNSAVATIDTAGILSGITPGFAIISYTLPTGCARLQEVAVSPLPHAGSISGDSVVAAGSSTTLSSSVEDGVWSASNSIATVSSTGVVTGVGAGAVVISYSFTNSCGTDVTTKIINVVPGVGSGSLAICVGGTTTLSGLPLGGTWVSGNTPLAVVNSAGVVTGLSAATVNISYTVSGITTVTVITVNTTPTNITGSLSVCNGATATLNSTPAGGTWSIAADSVATIGSTGILTGLSLGTATVSYTLANGCARSATATINTVPSAISGATTICVGSSTTLANDVPGGVFSSSNSSVATTSLSGVVTGVAAGSSTISYSIGGCRATTLVSVMAAPAITGTAAMCLGNSTSLSNISTDGTWNSSNSSIASVNATGLVTGAAAGTATISYTLSNGCIRTQVVTVNAPAIAAGPPNVCIGGTTNFSSTPATTSWISSTPSVATINSSGLVTGVSSGTTTLYMVTAAGCNSSTVINVSPQPTITGAQGVCLNGTTSLTGSGSGVSSWTSSSTGIASVNYLNGVVTGVNTGTATISYSLGIGQGCLRTAVVTVNGLPAITGTPAMCVSNSVALAGSPAGGSWSSITPAIATVSTGGSVTGVASGTANIVYTNATTGCAKTIVATINATPGAFIGSTSICAGTNTTLTNATSGGTWSSSNGAVATAGLSTGVINGLAAGTTNIIYRIGTCQSSTIFTVRALPANITGGMQTVVGATTTLADATAGGTWSSGNPAAGTISATGVVTGIGAGTSGIVYTASNGCTKSTIVTINAAPTLPGPRSVCVGSTINISSPTIPVSSWSSSDASRATVNASGVVTGVSAGTSTITYVLAAGGWATTEVTVLALPNTLTGSLNVCGGTTSTLASTSTGGNWTSGNSGLATVNSSGVVTGVAAGQVVITYTLATGCRRTATVTVNVTPEAITGSAAVCVGFTTTPYLASIGAGSWSSSNTLIATVPATHGAITGVSAGTALISFTNMAGCSTTREVTVSVCPSRGINAGTTSVNNMNDDVNISLYPNPTRGTFFVETPQAGTLSISTLEGREVVKQDMTAGTTELKLPSAITTGIYMCRFYGNEGAYTTVRLVFEAE